METEAIGLAREIDFSLFALFARATITVKIVMAGLMIMSFWSWAIIVRKLFTLRTSRSEATVFDRAFWSGAPTCGLIQAR